MHNVLEYRGDLLTTNVSAIAHQCNCVSKNAAGLAKAIFDAYPAANRYRFNPRPHMYGAWEAVEVQDAPFDIILNLYTQLNPGRPSIGIGQDGRVDRLLTFARTLGGYLSTVPPLVTSIAFPRFLGSGLAGGEWDDYRSTIFDVASANPDVEFHIVEKR